MSKTRFFLTVHTDQYTGNWDSFLSGLIFGYDDDRHGCEDGMKKHVGFPADDIDLVDHPDGDHNLPYKVIYIAGSEDGTTLEFALDAQLSNSQRAHLAAHYTGKAFSLETEFITILGFEEVRTKTVTETVSLTF